MKRQLSLLMLVSRSQLYRTILILAAMAVVQLGLALWRIQHPDINAGIAVETVLDWWPFRWTAALAMAGLFVCFGAMGRRGGWVDYTWYRLPVSQTARMFWSLVGGVLLFLLVWAVQLAAAMGAVFLFRQLQPERYHQQTLFLAAYRSSYFHGLLPLTLLLDYVSSALSVISRPAPKRCWQHLVSLLSLSKCWCGHE